MTNERNRNSYLKAQAKARKEKIVVGKNDFPKPKFNMAHVNLNLTTESEGTGTEVSSWPQQKQGNPVGGRRTGGNPQVPSATSGGPLLDLKRQMNAIQTN